MADLNSTAVAAGASAAGMLTITGGVLGMHYDTLILGFLGGMIALSFQDKASYFRMLMSVFSSATLAGFCTPLIVLYAQQQVPYLLADGGQALRCGAAGIIGVAAQAGVPLLLRKLGGLIDRVLPGAN